MTLDLSFSPSSLPLPIIPIRSTGELKNGCTELVSLNQQLSI
ncbi:hypothetical protein D515_01321 [Grimontia indica]|uniref:Uncharacterized protein n=1 Tax=Grimontia indica TaxID=1056512 RepID=R1IPZ7_9GAMM|nr:hypothetical protein D515_01321 [Grimontia indica]